MLYFNKHNLIRKLIISLLIIVSLFVNIQLFRDNYRLKNEIQSLNYLKITNRRQDTNGCTLDDQQLDNFTFDLNITGFPFNVVPNIVHYILFDEREVQFVHFISILSVLKNQKPLKIFIHCNCDQLYGQYYQRVLRVADKINTQIIVRKIERPTEIFGQNLSKEWLNWHAADITRIRVVKEFGGVYLDRDIYVAQPLDKFFKYEMTLHWGQNQDIQNAKIIGSKNARFLKLWLDSYRDYHSNSWYYNGGKWPTNYLIKRPELIHRAVGISAKIICPMLYNSYHKDWDKDYYMIHLYMRGNRFAHKSWCFPGKTPPNMTTMFNETNVRQLNVTFAEMTSVLLDFENRFK